MASFFKGIPGPTSLSTFVTINASISAMAMVFRTIVYEIIPGPVRNFISSKLSDSRFLNFASAFTFTIEQRWKCGYNEYFRTAEVYLPTIIGPCSNSLLLGSNDTCDLTSEPRLAIPVGEKVVDYFEGIRLEWTLHCDEPKVLCDSGRKYFLLRCKKKEREIVLEKYFPHVCQLAMSILKNRDNLSIYTYDQEASKWESSVFKHPSTFDTLAMEPKLKQSLIDDLNYFVKRQGYYNMIGKVWKRGYLLYGPPGTGKSSLVAAIANYVRYNVYDLQFQSVRSDAELRNILTSTNNRSIIVIEDIDCATVVSHDRLHGSSVTQDGNADQAAATDLGPTLSGLLNFMDGLWSSCGEEKIIIFTANCKDKLDPALLRPGRMDFHVKMEYCTSGEVLKMLAKSYVGTDDNSYISCIHGTINELKLKVTPAEVAQHLMKDDQPTNVLASFYFYLMDKVDQKGKSNVKYESLIEEEDARMESLNEEEAAAILYSMIEEENAGSEKQNDREIGESSGTKKDYEIGEASGTKDCEESEKISRWIWNLITFWRK